ncbi:MAG: biotin--[acetyl-CoA-carboxylase] ligase [Nitriliruptoraceae bacterium]
MSDDSRAGVYAAPAQTRWETVTHYSVVNSTNDVALRMVADTGQAHVVVTANSQTQGRGRLGRPWVHTIQTGVTPQSLAVTATLLAPQNAPVVPLAAGLAAYDACVALGVEPALKWPNDLLLSGRKAAGILVERVPINNFDLVVIGTGFNVDWRDVTRESDQNWISLAEEAGSTVDQDVLLSSYLVALDRWLDELATVAGLERLLRQYRACCVTLGQPVTVNLADSRQLHGVAVAIDDAGQLCLERDGTLITVTSGDVWHGVG